MPFAAAAYAFAVVMVGTTLPTPLYPLYARQFGFGATTVTVVFAAYAVGVIAALILVGRISDEIGRRPVLIPGIVLSALSAVLFLLAGNGAALYPARVVSGLSAGIFTGTATATLVDLAPRGRRELATSVAVAANLGGLAVGPLLSGVLSQWTALPLRLPYIVDLALLAPALAAVVAMPETVTRRATRLHLQRLRVPDNVRTLFVQATVVGFCGFAVSGLFGAVAPTFIARDLGIDNHAVSGAIVFSLFIFSAAGQVVTYRVPREIALFTGCAVLASGVVLLAVAIGVHSLGALVAAAVLSGAGQGLNVGAGLAAVNARVDERVRGEVASTYFVLLYFGLIIPVVGIGLLSDAIGLRDGGFVFSAVIGVLVIAVLASLGRTVSRPGVAGQAAR
jgi:MFS family permease